MARPIAGSVVAMLGFALLLAACSDAFLELDVSNQSADDAELQLVSGIEGDPARVPFVHYTELVNAGTQRTLAVERPGPDAWTLYVNGMRLTDSLHWPSDNPTLDFKVVVHPDGTAELRDE
jgi:hypothetical protein